MNSADVNIMLKVICMYAVYGCVLKLGTNVCCAVQWRLVCISLLAEIISSQCTKNPHHWTA